MMKRFSFVVLGLSLQLTCSGAPPIFLGPPLAIAATRPICSTSTPPPPSYSRRSLVLAKRAWRRASKADRISETMIRCSNREMNQVLQSYNEGTQAPLSWHVPSERHFSVPSIRSRVAAMPPRLLAHLSVLGSSG